MKCVRLNYIGKVYRVFLILTVGFVFYACSTTSETTSSKWNLSSIYNPSQSSLHPSYKIYHNASNTSLLYIKVFTNELSFQPVGTNGEIVSQLSINYVLSLAEENEKAIVDSGTYNLTITKKVSERFFMSQFSVNAETGKSYRLKLIMRDKIKQNLNLSFLEIEKKPGFGQQFFNLVYTDGSPIFRNVLIGDGAFRIMHPNPTSDKLFIAYYQNTSKPPKPTYAINELNSSIFRPDSVFVISYSPNTAISLAYNGLYYFSFDTISSEGVSVLKFDDDFPKVTKAEKLIEPLAYITTDGEYQKLLNSRNKKLAADDFWINAGGNTDRGREMVRIYYNRVYFSNYYFTTTREGWKTDRGMVYIVYGPPQNLRKTNNSEIWYYSKKGTGEQIAFTFTYSPDKYSINEYRLERSESNTWHWKEAVYAWTNGEIFLKN